MQMNKTNGSNYDEYSLNTNAIDMYNFYGRVLHHVPHHHFTQWQHWFRIYAMVIYVLSLSPHETQ